MHGHQSTGGGFRNIFNMVRGKVNDSTGRAMEGPKSTGQRNRTRYRTDQSVSKEERKSSLGLWSLSKEIFIGF